MEQSRLWPCCIWWWRRLPLKSDRRHATYSQLVFLKRSSLCRRKQAAHLPIVALFLRFEPQQTLNVSFSFGATRWGRFFWPNVTDSLTVTENYTPCHWSFPFPRWLWPLQPRSFLCHLTLSYLWNTPRPWLEILWCALPCTPNVMPSPFPTRFLFSCWLLSQLPPRLPF